MYNRKILALVPRRGNYRQVYLKCLTYLTVDILNIEYLAQNLRFILMQILENFVQKRLKF
jgi:hypothetical protein